MIFRDTLLYSNIQFSTKIIKNKYKEMRKYGPFK